MPTKYYPLKHQKWVWGVLSTSRWRLFAFTSQ